MKKLDKIIKKLSIILVLCGGIILILYFTDLGAIFEGEVKEKVEKKVEEFKKETEEKIEAKKEEVEEKIKEKKEKIEEKIEKVEDKIKDLKKLKLKDLLD